MEGRSHWQAWPRAEYAPLLLEKEAAEDLPPLSPEPSVENILGAITEQLPAIYRELPAGISKVAAQRPGTEEELPAVDQQNIWRHPHAHPLVLTLLLMDKYGEDYLQWDAEVLRTTIFRGGTALSNSVWTKIQAARVPLLSPSPWRQWETFNVVCRGLAGLQPNMTYFEAPELGHLAQGADILAIMDAPRDYNPDVDKFVAVACKDTGTPYAPPPLAFAQPEIDQPKFQCPSCGLVERDDNDVRCSHCGSPDITRVAGPQDARRDAVKAKFSQLKGLPLEEASRHLEENNIDMPVARLLMHWEYRNQSRARMVEQLKSVAGK